LRLASIPPAKVGAAWPHVERWVKAALARGSDHGPDDIRGMLDRRVMQLWLIWDGRPRGCCITELIETVHGRTCNIVVVAGEVFSAWRHLEADLARWARRDWGCTRLTLIGRRGWVRRLSGSGWRPTLVHMECRIDDTE
jgi:hypothetical protein